MNLITILYTHGQWAVKNISALLIYRKTLCSTTLGLLAALSFFFPGVISAQSQQVNASMQILLNVRTDNVVSAVYTIQLTNDTPGLLNNMHFRMPAVELEGANCTINNIACSATIDRGEQVSTVNLDFNVSPVRAGQTATITTSFDVKDLLKPDFGLRVLSLPPLETGYESGEVNVQIKFPQEFGAPSYISADQVQLEVDNLQLQANNGFLIIWGESATVQLSEKLQFAEVKEDDLVKFNLIPTLSQQRGLYKGLSDVYAAGIDDYLNIWGLYKKVANQPEYISQVVIDSSQKPLVGAEISYPKLKLPDELRDRLANDNSVSSKTTKITAYILDKFSATHDAAYSREKLNKAAEEIGSGRTEMHLVEYAMLAASYLQQSGVSAHIHYGYFLVDELPGIDTAAPHAWVEVLDGDNLIIVDPYFTEVTGFEWTNTPSIMRITLGVWNPDNSLDSMLGLLTGGVRLRPELASVSAPLDNTKQYSIIANMSSRVMAGGYYEGEMQVDNKSAEFIRIQQITIGSHVVDSEDLRIAGDLIKLIMPLQKTTIQFVNLREPDYLLQGNVTLYLKFTPLNPDFAAQETAVQIRFISDQRLLVIILIAAGTVATILVLVLLRLLFMEALTKRNARKQLHNMKEDKWLSKPKLAEKQNPNPRPIQQFGRTHKL